MKLNKEELIIASILTAIVVPFPIAIGAIPLCAFLWALTGASASKLFRRLGVPLVWALCLWNLYALIAVPIGFGMLCIGYGIPTTQPYDKGSWLGIVFFKLTSGNMLMSNILTKGTIYLGLLIPFLIVRWT